MKSSDTIQRVLSALDSSEAIQPDPAFKVEIGGAVIVKYWFWQTDSCAWDVYEGSTEPRWTELTGINLPAPGCAYNLINRTSSIVVHKNTCPHETMALDWMKVAGKAWKPIK